MSHALQKTAFPLLLLIFKVSAENLANIPTRGAFRAFFAKANSFISDLCKLVREFRPLSTRTLFCRSLIFLFFRFRFFSFTPFFRYVLANYLKIYNILCSRFTSEKTEDEHQQTSDLNARNFSFGFQYNFVKSIKLTQSNEI